jgi:hypothetical protein
LGNQQYMSAQRSSYSKKFAKDRFIYVSFEPSLMNKNRSMQTILLLGTILAVAMVGIANSNARVYAGNGDYDTGDDHINWKKFKNSNTYEDANKKTQKCFERAHDNGDNLAGYEVKNCEEDSGYGKDGNGDKNKDYGDKNKDDGDKNKDYGDKNKDDGNKNKDDGDKKKDYGDKNKDDGNKNKDDGNKNKDDGDKSKDSGDSGKSGDNGDSGDSGKSGDNGDSGDSGKSGDNGDSGDSGKSGDSSGGDSN